MKFKQWFNNLFQESETWNYFARQREFPFMKGPGYNRKATEYIDKDLIDPEIEYDTDFNLYHVTTNLKKVSYQGLKSRSQLGGVVGLGGGGENIASNKVSVTYDFNRALEIYHQFKFVCNIVNGITSASRVYLKLDDDLNDPYIRDEMFEILLEYLPEFEFKKIKNGKADERLLDKYIKTPKDVYEFFQRLEEFIMTQESSSESFYNYSTIGFTGTFEQMKQIDPKQIAILQLVAHKGAKSEHVPGEKELRFSPQDLKIVRYYQP